MLNPRRRSDGRALNEDRLSAGKTPIGHLAPVLYRAHDADPSIFHDVTKGNNKATAGGRRRFVCDEGFVAAPGWDATTGLGTINFSQLRKYAATLP